MTRQSAQGIVAWLDRYRFAVLALSVAVAVLGGMMVARMPVKADLAALLPPTRKSVIELTALQQRARPIGTVKIVIDAPSAELCSRGAEALSAALVTLPSRLVAQFSPDDSARDRFIWDHRFLLAPIDDLRAARDALRERIHGAKLEANPLYVQLDDEATVDGAAPDRLDQLVRKLADAERAGLQPTPRRSQDGRIRVLILQTAFSGADAELSNELIATLHRMIADVRREVSPELQVGLGGNITFGMYEHDSVLDGMAMSGLITVVLCAIGLLLYYRSGLLVLAMLWALLTGVAATFAIAKVMVGNLNVMTAFLFAIVIGNGINAALIFVARFLEERRASDDVHAALARAMSGALRGTLAAAATAAVSYLSLLAAAFRGFREFGAIAAVGMVVTWITTFTVLPAAICVLARMGRLRATRPPPAIGSALAHLLDRRRRWVALAFGALITAVSLVITVVFVLRGPFTQDWRDLQTRSPGIEQARAVEAKADSVFKASSIPSGGAYQFAIAVERREQVAPLLAQLRAEDASRPPERRWLESIYSLEDLVPSDQAAKRDVLNEIRALIDDPAVRDVMSADEFAKLAKVRPPDELETIRDEDVPPELGWLFVERDGARGRMIVLKGAPRFKNFHVGDRLEFAREVRRIQLPPGAIAGGLPLVFAEIVESMARDAARMTLFALVGAVLAVLLLVGIGRHGVVTLVCGFAGVLAMIAACAVVGLKAHFLDLIALPITIGVGIDYAANLASRDRQDGQLGPGHLLRTTGGTVLLCSYTTMVGYGTLLLSANGGIRSFGLAALLGEVTCIVMALIVAPTWLAVWRARTRTT